MTRLRRDPAPSRPATGPGRRRPLTAQEWEQTNRLGLLLLHALIGLVAGLLILFNGTAPTFDQWGDWVRLLTGGLAFVGGAVLAAGLVLRSTSIGTEMVGLVILTLWALTMAAGFVLASLGAGALVIDWPWRSFPQLQAERLYPIAIYVGLFLMTSLHLWTASRVRQHGLSARHRGVATGGQPTADPRRGPLRTGQQRVIAAAVVPPSLVELPSLTAWRVGVAPTETAPPATPL